MRRADQEFAVRDQGVVSRLTHLYLHCTGTCVQL